MTSIKQEAEAYEPTTTRNISELESVSVDIEVYDKTFKQGTPEEFSVKLALIEGEEYRIPLTVLRDLKAILESKPDMKTFRVNKSGQGMGTTYTVIRSD